MGVQIGRASGGGVGAFCFLHETSMTPVANMVKIKMDLKERMRVLSRCKQADLCEDCGAARLGLWLNNDRTINPSVRAAKE